MESKEQLNMNNEMSRPSNVIQFLSPPFCGHCTPQEPKPKFYDINIFSIESGNEGWIARGRGSLIQTYCDRCGSIYNAILYTIPIQCASFPCPNCNEQQNFNYKIRSIITKENSFEFEAEIECSKCKKKKSFKKILTKILDVVNIEIQPTGITVKKK